MRIQWNSGAVEEALARLRSAQDGLEACKSRAQRIRRQFADANPDGENRALRAAENRFAQCWTQMQRLAERVDGFESALRRAGLPPARLPGAPPWAFLPSPPASRHASSHLPLPQAGSPARSSLGTGAFSTSVMSSSLEPTPSLR